MKACLVTFAALLAAVVAQSAVTPLPPVISPLARGFAGAATPIVNQNFEQGVDGSYTFGYASADGSTREETSVAKNVGTDAESHAVSGSYSYISPEGTPVTVNYVADEDGYRASGNVINPSVGGESVLERQRALFGYTNAADQYNPYRGNYPGAYSNNVYNGAYRYPGAYRAGAYPGAYRAGAYPGAYANGAYANGAYANGAYANGAYVNGAYANGVYPNAAYPGAYRNGIYSGAYKNGAYPGYINPAVNPAVLKNLPAGYQAAVAKDIDGSYTNNYYNKYNPYYRA